MGDALPSLAAHPPPDPDAQATITDFIDYTEFFPSDLFRSTTLIGKLDKTYLHHASKVHELTKAYSNLPSLPEAQRPDPSSLRHDISTALASALHSRESAYAEATRLSTVANNLTTRISTILRKLQALPKPPSRDPTPPPKSRSPVSQRGRKRNEGTTPRIKLKTDSEPIDSIGLNASRPKHFKRRLIVPGEVLPPFEPGSPGDSDESSSESERQPTPVPLPVKERPLKFSRPRLGTNIHSSVAGISVSNAMAQLVPPPTNPTLGSKHAPWLKLTEWELNKIRKRMKKNADWLPSEIMIKRELAASGRGKANYLAAKARAAETGEEFFDEEPEDFKRPVNFRTRTTQPVLGPGGEEQLINNGMKLNEAKKLKRKLMLEEAAEREEANRRITQAGLAVDDLFAPVNGNIVGGTPTSDPQKKNKKRKRLSSPSLESPNFEEDEVEDATPNPKKIRLGSTASHKSASPFSDTGNAPTKTRPREQESNALHPTTSNRPSRRGESIKVRGLSKSTSPSIEASEQATTQQPTGLKLRLDPAKLSAVDTNIDISTPPVKSKSASTSVSETAAGRRPKRLSSDKQISDSDINSTVGIPNQPRSIKLTQRTRPRSSQSDSAITQDSGADTMKAKPGEEVYCLCREPGGGRMIACEDPNCKIEWFHFECVGLNPKDDKRFSRLYWYCPDCRGRHGVAGDGTTTKD